MIYCAVPMTSAQIRICIVWELIVVFAAVVFGRVAKQEFVAVAGADYDVSTLTRVATSNCGV
jgi:hypothetical protein